MKKKTVLVLVIVLVCTGYWIWRYVSLNSYYENLSNLNKVTFSAGEMVPFGSDYLEKDLNADGYWIRVDSFEIYDYHDYVRENEIEVPSKVKPPERIALVSVTISNIGSTAPGVMLTELILHGHDSYASMDWDLLLAINPILEGNMGIGLQDNSQIQLLLPFSLYQYMYSNKTWNDMDSYDLFLRITSFPTAKDIEIR